MNLAWFRNYLIGYSCMIVAGLLVSCQNQSSETEKPLPLPETEPAQPGLFTLLPPEETHIDFNNELTEGLNTNVMAYEYFYNGGGVAIGDVNNDGWEDMYFTGNMIANKLYLNKGGKDSLMVFEDVTQQARVAGKDAPWATGVTMADVNGDGLLDIYVCYSGNMPPEKRTNELYINQGADSLGIPHFIEQAAEYGLASSATSTQAVFFDYDRDGDLDMFLLNHSPFPLPVLDDANTAQILKEDDPSNGPRLYRHDSQPDGTSFFNDVTSLAGISSSALSYGLGVGIADVNGDGWPDMYISNDYSIPDFLYINNQNGTFTNELADQLGHTSHFSMGNDIADINNDALPDIYTLDMLPEDNRRQKLLFAPDNYELFNFNVRMGFYYQYMRNMLQMNNGNDSFSEIGQVAGISNTDWSWAPLFADYDNDGWKDLFITNGYVRDYTNMDFIKSMGDFVRQKKGRIVREDVLELVYQMPATNITNYIFKNNGTDAATGVTFSNMKSEWGMDVPSNSNGAAYADLDHDGDLDLIINNINKPAFIYKNESDKQAENHYLEIELKGTDKNTLGIGTKVTIYSKGKQQYQEQMPTRGYQSSVSTILHFGLGAVEKIDTLQVNWLRGKQQILTNIDPDQKLIISEKGATYHTSVPEKVSPIYKSVRSPVSFQHKKNSINDFKRQPLIVNPLSFSGPCMKKADVNGDGLEDVYVGGGSTQAGKLFIQQKNSTFIQKNVTAFEIDHLGEDVNAAFFDANGDGALDLYVCSGGYGNFTPQDLSLQDRLYINDGKGNFTKKINALPVMLTSTSCAKPADINGDGHIDLFVGGRVIPGRYPETPESYILINDGSGNFKNMVQDIAPQLQKAGMVTDAAWIDLNNDKVLDLIVVGEWMPITVFVNSAGKLLEKTSEYFDKTYSGWWNKLLVNDLNNDGKPDLVLGNMGLNTQCKASDQQPARLYYKDFDDNGSIDPVFTFYIQGESYPSVMRDELLEQMSMMRTRFPNYRSYADAKINKIFTEEELSGAYRLEANELKTLYFERGKNGKFQMKSLPLEVQYSPVFTITKLDYNKDGKPDLLLCGNINHARLRFGNSDANFGVLLKGNGKGNFEYIRQDQSGFNIWGDVRSVVEINNTLLFGINQEAVKAYKLN